MSNFSTIFDQLVDTTIPALTGFSTKTKLSNPYDLADNDEGQLRDGYGLIIGAADETTPQYMCDFTVVSQEIAVVLTRVVISTPHNTTPLDTAVKALVEDAVTIRKDFYNPDQLTIPSNIEKIQFNNRSGIEYISDEFKFVATTVFFTFDIKESL